MSTEKKNLLPEELEQVAGGAVLRDIDTIKKTKNPMKNSKFLKPVSPDDDRPFCEGEAEQEQEIFFDSLGGAPLRGSIQRPKIDP